MSDFATLRSQAEALGLAGEAAAAYITEQQNFFRDERQRERELEQSRIELEKRKIDTEHEANMARLRSRSGPALQAEEMSVARPTLPELKDGEDISLYLIRFDRV